MWVVSVTPGLTTGVGTERVVVQHKDLSSPRSICQALRLMREHLVRVGKEDKCRILKAEWEPGLCVLRHGRGVGAAVIRKCRDTPSGLSGR